MNDKDHEEGEINCRIEAKWVWVEASLLKALDSMVAMMKT